MASAPTEVEVMDTLCRRNISWFTQRAFSIASPGVEYKHNWHIDCIAEHLHAVHDGDIKRLIINMPPRCMKSLSVSVAFPAWLLGQNPSEQIIAASYSQEPISTGLNRLTLNVLRSEWYRRVFPETVLSPSEQKASLFRTTEGGARFATSVGGTVTGMGGNYLILDDPNKPEESLSATVRMSTNEWVDGTFMSRFNNPKEGRAILVMQRLNFEDVSGHLMDQGHWHPLILPAEAPKKTTIELRGLTWQMSEGELLHEERLPKDILEQKRIELGSYSYAGQYLQSPVPVGGGAFKQEWIQYFKMGTDGRPLINYSDMNIHIIVDPANSKKLDADSTAMVVIGLSVDHNYYILDIVRDKFNLTERIECLMNLHRKWSQLGGRPPSVGYERYGIQADVQYLKEVQERQNYRFGVRELAGKLSKEDRIIKLVPIVENMRLYFPPNLMYNPVGEYRTKGAIDLVKAFIEEEMLTFPRGGHDDMLDALARIVDPDMYAAFPELQEPIEIRIDGSASIDEDYGEDWMDL